MVTTKMTWNDGNYVDNPAFMVAKESYIVSAKQAGKTDGTHQIIDGLTSTRTWADQTAADDWTTFIKDLATKYGYTVTVV